MKMQLKKIFVTVFVLSAFLVSCNSLPSNESSDELISDEIASEDVSPEVNSSTDSDFTDEASDDFADFGGEEGSTATEVTQAGESEAAESLLNEASQDVATEELPKTDELPASDELLLSEEQPAQVATEEVDEFQEFENEMAEQSNTPAETVTNLEPEPTSELTLQEEPNQELIPEPTPVQEIAELAPKPMTPALAEIRSVQYKANEAGGTLVIDASQPVEFQMRRNTQNNQIIVEIPNANLPERLRRPLNMRDMVGTIGSVDAYQGAGSTTARFVIQMRNGTNEPFITKEGNSILVVAEKELASAPKPSLNPNSALQASATVEESKALNSKDINDFLDSNSRFYGRKISIETVGMPVKDALRFIADEAGVNIIIDPEQDLDTRLVNLKMREVPWDQAFIVILRTNNLGYVRIGNLLRVAKLSTLAAEEKAAAERSLAAANTAPLKFKIFEINFAKASEIQAKVDKFKTTRGQVFSDDRSNQLIVQDTEENLRLITDVVQKFDNQPPQVLIEGRIIEAAENFTRSIGVNWSAGGTDLSIGNGISLRPSLGVTTSDGAANGSLSLQMGTLDVLGDLTASLALSEVEGKIRILSSPRVVTLSNETATISQGTQIPVVGPPTSVNGVTTVGSVEYKDVNLQLEVTPQVTADASVLMGVKVTRSLVSAASVSGEAPAIDTRQATTRVMVKNGQTSIIGGVYQNDTSSAVTGVPWLKDLPLVGGLFRFKENRNTRNELMIFITPRVISVSKNPTLAQASASEGAIPNEN